MATYTEEDVKNALIDVQNSVAVNAAATHHSVPYSTLRGRINGAQPHRYAHSDEQRLTAIQEKHLEHWILRQKALGYASTYTQVRAIVSGVLKQQGDYEPLGKKWSKHFIWRYPAIKTKLGRRTNWERIKSVGLLAAYPP